MKLFSMVSEARALKKQGRNDPPVDGAIMWLSADDYDPTTGVWNNRADAFYRLRCAARKLVSVFDVFVFANILTIITTAAVLALAGYLLGV